MNFQRMSIGAILAGLVVGLLISQSMGSAQAQSTAFEKGQVEKTARGYNVDCQNADVREALRSLFGQMGTSYSIDPGVQGTVTASLTGVSLETALKTIMDQVNATYRIEGGVYQIVPRRTIKFAGGPTQEDSTLVFRDTNPPPAPHEPVMIQDNGFVYVLMGNTLFKVRKSNMAVEGQAALRPGESIKSAGVGKRG